MQYKILLLFLLQVSWAINDASANHADNCVPSKNTEASNIAMKAAQEAKAAEDAQVPAGQQAARQVKEQLAEKAVEAAKAADAALAGKEALVQQLQEEIKEADVVVCYCPSMHSIS